MHVTPNVDVALTDDGDEYVEDGAWTTISWSDLERVRWRGLRWLGGWLILEGDGERVHLTTSAEGLDAWLPALLKQLESTESVSFERRDLFEFYKSFWLQHPGHEGGLGIWWPTIPYFAVVPLAVAGAIYWFAPGLWTESSAAASNVFNFAVFLPMLYYLAVRRVVADRRLADASDFTEFIVATFDDATATACSIEAAVVSSLLVAAEIGILIWFF